MGGSITISIHLSHWLALSSRLEVVYCVCVFLGGGERERGVSIKKHVQRPHVVVFAWFLVWFRGVQVGRTRWESVTT